jgi:IclR family transcriptional regulator, KDG regulon repressor
MQGSRRQRSYTISTTLTKAFAILEYIAEHQPVKAAEIVGSLGLTKGNVHSLLASLEYLGYVEKHGGGFSLSFKVHSLGNTVPLTRDIAATARPVMERIAEEVQANVYLTAPVDNKIVNLERVVPSADIQIANDFAVSYDLHCTASGKLYLSTLSEERRHALYEGMTFSALTVNSIRDPEALDRELEETRRRGYSLETGEHSRYINGIAAPVLNHDGTFMASLSVIGPAMILPPDELEELAPRLLREARKLSRLMGNLGEAKPGAD